MIDHVGISLPSLAEGSRFYGRALELLGYPGEPAEGGGFVEWDDFAIGEATAGSAGDAAAPHRLLRALTGSRRRLVAGAHRRGPRERRRPGPRPAYGPEYYGAFVLDPAGNSVEAVNNGPRRQPGVIDHLWLRTRSLEDATRFYEAVCPAVDHTVERYDGRTQIRGSGATFSIVEGPPTENLHLAFAAPDRETVAAFHQAGVAAGFASNGEPGERPEYHPGYYGAFLTDPDGNNIEAVFHDR